jgi:hypothetical protein
MPIQIRTGRSEYRFSKQRSTKMQGRLANKDGTPFANVFGQVIVPALRHEARQGTFFMKGCPRPNVG